MHKAFTLAAAGLGAWWLYRTLSRPSYSFRGKNAFITGGSRGLGLLMARELALRGARLSLCARRDEELDAAREELPRSGVAVETIHCDVTDQAQVADCVRQAREFFGPVDVLINNAGIINVAPMEEMRLDDFERAMKTHFYGALYMTMEVLPEMKRRQQGRIINISSLGGKVAVPHMLPYTASKFALTGFSEGLRNECRKDGIYVLTVCPSPMRTGSHIQAEFKGQHELEYAWFAGLCGLPGFSVSGESAARSILDACARGDAELIIGLPGQVAVLLNGLSPELMAMMNELVNQLLPGPGGIGTQAAKGYDSRGALPAAVTTLPDRAALRNNETNQDPKLAMSIQGDAS